MFNFKKSYQQGRRNLQINLGKMSTELRSNRISKRREEPKEEIKHLFGELYDFGPHETF